MKLINIFSLIILMTSCFEKKEEKKLTKDPTQTPALTNHTHIDRKALPGEVKMNVDEAFDEIDQKFAESFKVVKTDQIALTLATYNLTDVNNKNLSCEVELQILQRIVAVDTESVIILENLQEVKRSQGCIEEKIPSEEKCYSYNKDTFLNIREQFKDYKNINFSKGLFNENIIYLAEGEILNGEMVEIINPSLPKIFAFTEGKRNTIRDTVLTKIYYNTIEYKPSNDLPPTKACGERGLIELPKSFFDRLPDRV